MITSLLKKSAYTAILEQFAIQLFCLVFKDERKKYEQAHRAARQNEYVDQNLVDNLVRLILEREIKKREKKAGYPLKAHNARDAYVEFDVAIRGQFCARKSPHHLVVLLLFLLLVSYVVNGENKKDRIHHDYNENGHAEEHQIGFAIAYPACVAQYDHCRIIGLYIADVGKRVRLLFQI